MGSQLLRIAVVPYFICPVPISEVRSIGNYPGTLYGHGRNIAPQQRVNAAYVLQKKVKITGLLLQCVL